MKVIEVPLLIAKQSSWFLLEIVSFSVFDKETTSSYIFAPEMVTPVELPTSNASVLCPSESVSPAELSIVRPETVRVVAPLMLINCTGEFKKFSPVMVDDVKLWA